MAWSPIVDVRITEDTDLDSREYRVVTALLRYMHPAAGTWTCTVSDETLSKAAGLSLRTTQRAINVLKSMGYLTARDEALPQEQRRGRGGAHSERVLELTLPYRQQIEDDARQRWRKGPPQVAEPSPMEPPGMAGPIDLAAQGHGEECGQCGPMGPPDLSPGSAMGPPQVAEPIEFGTATSDAMGPPQVADKDSNNQDSKNPPIVPPQRTAPCAEDSRGQRAAGAPVPGAATPMLPGLELSACVPPPPQEPTRAERIAAWQKVAKDPECPRVTGHRHWSDKWDPAWKARLAEEAGKADALTPAEAWGLVCRAVKQIDHWAGRDVATRDEKHKGWSCNIPFVLRQENWHRAIEEELDRRERAQRAEEAERARRVAFLADPSERAAQEQAARPTREQTATAASCIASIRAKLSGVAAAKEPSCA